MRWLHALAAHSVLDFTLEPFFQPLKGTSNTIITHPYSVLNFVPIAIKERKTFRGHKLVKEKGTPRHICREKKIKWQNKNEI